MCQCVNLIDTLFIDTLFIDTLFIDTLFIDTLFIDTLFISTLFISTLKNSVSLCSILYPNQQVRQYGSDASGGDARREDITQRVGKLTQDIGNQLYTQAERKA